jgi:O-antigen/teichoic acid export membrane protein
VSPATPDKVRESRAKDVRHAASGGGVNFLYILSGLAIPLWHTVIARAYGPVIYGLYGVAYGVTEMFSRFSYLKTETALLRQIAHHRVAGEVEMERRSVRTAVWLTAAFGTLLGAVAFALAGPLADLQGKPETREAIAMLAPVTPFVGLIEVFVAATMSVKILRYNLYVRGLAQHALLVAFAGAFALFSPTIVSLCLSHVLAIACTAVLAFLAARSVLRDLPLSDALLHRPRTDPLVHWELVRFSLPLGVSEFLNAVLQRADLLILAFYMDEAHVGYYFGAEMISRAVSNARYVFDSVAGPVLSEAFRQDDKPRLRYNLKLMARWVAILTFPIVTFVVGFRSELLGLLGEGFVAAGTAFIILNVGHLVNGILGVNGWVVTMSGRTMWNLWNNLAAASANIALCFLLVPDHGLIGAAISAAASVTLIQVLFAVETAFLLKVHPFSWSLLRVAVAGGVTLVATLLFSDLLPEALPLKLATGTVLMLAGYVALLGTLGLAREDRELVAKAWARVRGRGGRS